MNNLNTLTWVCQVYNFQNYPPARTKCQHVETLRADTY